MPVETDRLNAIWWSVWRRLVSVLRHGMS